MIIQDICHSWLRFERQFGSLDDFDLATKKVSYLSQRWTFELFG